MSQILLILLPDECLPLVILGLGFAVMFGILGLGQAMGIILGLLLLVILAPFIEALIGALPVWASVLLMIWLCVAIFDALFGRRTRDYVVGGVMAGIILAILFLPFRIMGRLLGFYRRR